MEQVTHRELAKFIRGESPIAEKFYTKENGDISYIHYFDAGGETVVHESFIYSSADARDKDFKIISK